MALLLAIDMISRHMYLPRRLDGAVGCTVLAGHLIPPVCYDGDHTEPYGVQRAPTGLINMKCFLLGESSF